MPSTPYLNLLRNHIDITLVPFSDRGSRLLVMQQPGRSRLMVRLAERLTGLEPDIEAYLRRPPFIQDLCLIDEQGDPLEFEVTTQPHVLYLSTRLGDFGLVFQDRRTLSFGLPDGAPAGIRFQVYPQYWNKTQKGGFFKYVRNLGYDTSGEVVRNHITPTEGGFEVEFVAQSSGDCAIAITIQPTNELEQEILPFSVAQAASEDRWRDWFGRVPPVADRYRRTYAFSWWVMANNLISPQGNVTYESMAPSKINYVGLWLWDNAMHSLAYRHIDPNLARNQIRAMLAHQLPNGMLPDAVFDEGVVATLDHPIFGEVTKPPILAWAALKLHETDPDIQFLEEIYVPLVRLNAWWLNMNDDDGDGLAQYNHPYSSGLDDSPLWDYGMPVESPDLNTYLTINMNSLSTIAELLGMSTEAGMWRRRASAMVQRMIKDFWDDQAGLFWATRDGQRIPVVTPFNLYPLWTGQLPEELNSLLVAHLKDPEEFWGEYVIPTVARNDPHYNPDTMWRGPVWANINYFFIEALNKVGEHELARELRSKTLEIITGHNTVYEYYNAETGEAPDTAAVIFGWTAAVFIDLAIQASRQEEAEGL